MKTIFIEKTISHYYGDLVRFLFILIGAIVLMGMPSYAALLGLPIWYAVAAVVALGIAAGLTNPLVRGSLILNIVISAIGLVNFIVLSWFMRSQGLDGFMLVMNQILAVLFLITLYLSIKSLRGYYFTNDSGRSIINSDTPPL